VWIVVVSRTTDGCFFHRCSRLLFGVLGCRQRKQVIDMCHFLVCHSSVVASVFTPSGRVITAKPFQPMMNLRCPTAARPVLDVEHVDGLGDGNESRKEAVPRMSCRIQDHYRLTRSHQHIADVIGPLLRWSCKTSRRDRPFHPQLSPLQVIARRNGTSPIHA